MSFQGLRATTDVAAHWARTFVHVNTGSMKGSIASSRTTAVWVGIPSGSKTIDITERAATAGTPVIEMPLKIEPTKTMT